ncbi:MAG: LysM peptidoglycan-binding domain-containing protein [Spirochaetaceae bacterium]|jgi:membrane-bound lytic murein transglycosylase D|nr:LysM peptidoglycan-binding domain-containing protein [Spirochaetaceae bacterium]
MGVRYMRQTSAGEYFEMKRLTVLLLRTRTMLKIISCFSLALTAAAALYANQPLTLPEPSITNAQIAVIERQFDRPLRRQQSSIPQRLERQQRDRTRFPAISSIYGMDNPLTESYIKRYSASSGLIWISSVMKKAEPYLAFVRNEIEQRGLPPELLYLPVIESGYTSTAVSSSGAAGLWQFMRNSIKPYMIISEYLDERMDFWKSTRGALSKLEENHNNYKDWALSLAAYNSGSGAINRIIKQTGINDYWTLSAKKHLKTESIHYVPKLIAVYYIASNPRKFGLDISWKPVEIEWARLPVDRQADLRVLAEHAGLDKDELLKMNRELYNHITPPAPYMLKVKKDDVEAVQAVFDNQDIKLINNYYYRIKQGDTLSVLAQHYGVSVNQILAQNPGVASNLLQIDKMIAIPAIKDVAAYTGTPPAAVSAVKQTAPGIPMTNVWTVKKGDTLWTIARLHGVSPEALAKANGIAVSGALRIGLQLKVP